jgi:hypothetical protein
MKVWLGGSLFCCFVVEIETELPHFHCDSVFVPRASSCHPRPSHMDPAQYGGIRKRLWQANLFKEPLLDTDRIHHRRNLIKTWCFIVSFLIVLAVLVPLATSATRISFRLTDTSYESIMLHIDYQLECQCSKTISFVSQFGMPVSLIRCDATWETRVHVCTKSPSACVCGLMHPFAQTCFCGAELSFSAPEHGDGRVVSFQIQNGV